MWCVISLAKVFLERKEKTWTVVWFCLKGLGMTKVIRVNRWGLRMSAAILSLSSNSSDNLIQCWIKVLD